MELSDSNKNKQVDLRKQVDHLLSGHLLSGQSQEEQREKFNAMWSQLCPAERQKLRVFQNATTGAAPAEGELTLTLTAPSEEGTAPSEEGTAPAEEGTAPAEEGTAPAEEGVVLMQPCRIRY
jgi:hypothetical protein